MDQSNIKVFCFNFYFFKIIIILNNIFLECAPKCLSCEGAADNCK